MTNRREFIPLLGGALAWPLPSLAQLAGKTYRIGLLLPYPASMVAVEFFDELHQLGFVQGQNLIVDSRGSGSSYARFSAIAAELVSAGPDAIVCAGDEAIRAAQAATRTIPIVATTDDMVGSGLVRSLSRPGGNTTGASLLAADLDGKRQEVLIEMMPMARRMAVLADKRTSAPARLQIVTDGARRRGIELFILWVDRNEEIASAVEAAKAAEVVALNVLASPLLHGARRTIIERANELRLPAIYQWPETAEEGGLLAYGPRLSEFFRQWARLLSKILRGASPADLPVEQPTRFELVVNLRTAHAIGYEIPSGLVLRANKVIE